MAIIKDLEKVGLQFLISMSDFLDGGVLEPDWRVEVVVSGRTASDVMFLVPDYGTRLVDFYLGSGVVYKTSKNWPFYFEKRMTSALRRLRCIVRLSDTKSFNREYFFIAHIIVFSIF